MWMQGSLSRIVFGALNNMFPDIPDQTSIVRQYMRHTAQINSGRTVAQVVNRALQMCVTMSLASFYYLPVILLQRYERT
jgi:thiamine pyrophosphate-dependent acetolactate synthase large subunit-like protein